MIPANQQGGPKEIRPSRRPSDPILGLTDLYYYFWADGTDDRPMKGWLKGDSRAALTPFKAAEAFKNTSYKW